MHSLVVDGVKKQKEKRSTVFPVPICHLRFLPDACLWACTNPAGKLGQVNAHSLQRVWESARRRRSMYRPLPVAATCGAEAHFATREKSAQHTQPAKIPVTEGNGRGRDETVLSSTKQPR